MPPKYKKFSFAIYNYGFSSQSLPQIHLLLPSLRNFVIATGLECTVVAHVLNEPESIERLYSDHHSWLLGWLRGRLGNAFDAADLAQDTFVRVLLRRPLPPLRQPRSYLSTIARGLVVIPSRAIKFMTGFPSTVYRPSAACAMALMALVTLIPIGRPALSSGS